MWVYVCERQFAVRGFKSERVAITASPHPHPPPLLQRNEINTAQKRTNNGVSTNASVRKTIPAVNVHSAVGSMT